MEGVSKDRANVDVESVWNRRRQLFKPRFEHDFSLSEERSYFTPYCERPRRKTRKLGSANLFDRWTLFEGFLNPALPPPLAYLCQHEVVDKRVPVFSCVEGRTKRFCPREVIPGQGRRWWLPLPFIVQSGHRPVVLYRPLCSATLFPLYTRPLSAPIVHPSRLSCQRKLGKQRKTRVPLPR